PPLSTLFPYTTLFRSRTLAVSMARKIRSAAPSRSFAAQQGGGVHHHRWSGQRAGRRRTDARFLRRIGLSSAAIPLHRPFARMVGDRKSTRLNSSHVAK